MPEKPVFGAYDITVNMTGKNAQSALEKGLSGIKATLKSFDNFFDPLVKEVNRTADSITIRAYAASKNLAQLESKIKELHQKLALPTGQVDELGIPIREPAIIGVKSADKVSLDRSRVFINNERDAAAMRARAANAGYAIQKDPSGAPGSYIMNAPSDVAGYYRRDIRRLNKGSYSAEAAQEQMRDTELAKREREANEDKMAKAELARRKEVEKERARINRMTDKIGHAEDKDGKRGSSLRGSLAFLGLGAKLGLFGVLLHELVKYTKMIYGLVVESAGRARADIMASSATGISATKLSKYRSFAESKGLDPEVYNSSFSSVVGKFGNITKLDQGSLESLALVMGSGIKDLILSGIGGDNPDALLGKILDAFTGRALSGKNSVGMDVGVSDAVTELTEYLRKIDPNWASIFSVKVAESLSPILTPEQRRSAATGGLMWDKGVVTNAFGKNDLDEQWMSDIKNNLDEMTSLVSQLKDALGRWLAPIADGIAEMVKSFIMKFGDPRQKQAIYDSNMREAQARLSENSLQDERVERLLKNKRSEMKRKYGISLSNLEENRMNAGETPKDIRDYEPKNSDDAKAYASDVNEYRLLSGTSWRLKYAIKDLEKEASPSNKTPSDTSLLSYDRIVSLATKDSIAATDKFVRSEIRPGKKGIFGSYYNDYVTRGISGSNANEIEAMGNKEYLLGKAAWVYSSLNRQNQERVTHVEVRNKDNMLTIQLIDKDKKVVESVTTQVGIPVGDSLFGIDDLGISNVSPTSSSGEKGSFKQMKNSNALTSGGGRAWLNP